MVQLGWKKRLIKGPLVKNLSEGLFEIRTTLPSHRIARVIFCLYDESIILLHAFIKKSRAIPMSALILAKKRKKLIQQNG